MSVIICPLCTIISIFCSNCHQYRQNFLTENSPGLKLYHIFLYPCRIIGAFVYHCPSKFKWFCILFLYQRSRKSHRASHWIFSLYHKLIYIFTSQCIVRFSSVELFSPSCRKERMYILLTTIWRYTTAARKISTYNTARKWAELVNSHTFMLSFVFRISLSFTQCVTQL